MLAILESYLKTSPPGLPPAGVTTVSLEQRNVGLGNRRGNSKVGSLATLSLKGGRLEAVVRFQLWGSDAATADSLVADLQNRLLADKVSLWNSGFLKLSQVQTSLAENTAGGGGWRKTTDYQLLYEYHYSDLDGAESLIAAIPIDSDLEERDSGAHETTTVRDEMVRWDNLAAPVLQIRRNSTTGVRISGLATLAYLPGGWSGGAVSLSLRQSDNPAPPAAYPTLNEFLDAVCDADTPTRHAQVEMLSLEDFIAAFSVAGTSVPLGDWDEDGTLDAYLSGTLIFPRPIILQHNNHFFQVSYQDASFDTPAVVYLRVQVRG